VKLFNVRLDLRRNDLRQKARAIPQHRPAQHVVCLHHNERPIILDRYLDGRSKREITAKGDIAFLPADAPTRLSLATDEPRVLSFSYLVLEPAYLTELALTNGIGRPLDLIPTFATPDLFCTKSLPLSPLHHKSRIPPRTSLLRACSTRQLLEFCVTTPKSDIRSPARHD
jgi:hypothetical protein